MTRPGDRLRAFAARWCSADMLNRVIDPLIADVQAEHHEAVTGGRVWRGRWTRLVGVMAFIRVVATCAVTSTARTMTTWPADDRRALVRAVGVGVIAMAFATALLVNVPGVRFTQASGRHPNPLWMLYLTPQGIPLAVPFGVVFGAFLGLGASLASFRLRAAVLALALVCSAASLANILWVVPPANQAFRVAVFQALTTGAERERPLAKGPAEMTRRELRERIASAQAQGLSTNYLDQISQRRSALPWASLALALFALAVTPRRPVRAWILGTVALSAYLGYFGLLTIGETLGRREAIPIFLAAWLPNLVYGAIAGILMVRSALAARSRAIPQ